MLCVILLLPSPSSTYIQQIILKPGLTHLSSITKSPSAVNSTSKCFEVEWSVVTLVTPMTHSIALKNNNDAQRCFKGRIHC